MNRSKGFIVFGAKDDDLQVQYALLAGHAPSSGIYAL